MESSRLSHEKALYGLAIALAIGLRLVNLGSVPLSDREATWALQAWEIARGNAVVVGPQPGYVLPTALVFFFLGSSTALARLLPALAGGLLAGAPYYLRPPLDRKAALILAFGLALDPGLIALSRQASGAMIAVSCGVLAYAAWSRGRPVVAGSLAGLAILGGSAAVAGLLAAALSWGVARALGLHRSPESLHEKLAEGRVVGPEAEIQPLAVRAALFSVGGTVLLAGTLFMRVPQGIGALADVVPSYLAGWMVPSGVPALRLGAAFLFYHPLPAIFGLVSAARSWWRGNGLARRMSIWLLAAFFLAALNPGRLVADLVWALIPLWVLAAMFLAEDMAWDPEVGLISSGQAVITVVFLIYGWLNLSALARAPGDPQTRLLRWELIGGALGLVLVTSILVVFGWSWRAARYGLVWGLWFCLGIFTLGVSWRAADTPAGRVHEWWFPQPSAGQEDLLLKTLGDVSEWNTGRRDGLEVLVVMDSPSMRWSLREHPRVALASSLASAAFSPLVIADSSIEPRLAAAYRGTDFEWQISPVWDGIWPLETLRWLAFRQAPTQSSQVILWARNDLFVEGSP